ncbi:hypothetical protein [Curtobacterium luteum]|uniref:DUF7882 family protein n=1 Tax=Curtobacterium luteum TaxID=33881 RepID=UPI003815C5BE
MGRLIYGSNITVEVDDQSLFHLDALLSGLNRVTFQLHVILGEARDGNLLSLSVGDSAPLALEYGNSADLQLSVEVMEHMSNQVETGGFVTLPLAGAAPARRS